jgi:hypothetical protein
MTSILLACPPGFEVPNSDGEAIDSVLTEKLTKTDKDEIKSMISKELKRMVDDEVAKAIKSKQIKDDIGAVTKKVLKQLYKDLSFHHPYIIDRIKV